MKLLIDGDIILYRGLFGAKNYNYYGQLRACDGLLEGVIEAFNCDFEVVVSGGSSFRKILYPEYKANRKPKSRPQYLYDAKKYIIRYWDAVVAVGEADDYISFNHNDDTVIVSIDKDFMQCGGKFFNPVKWEMTEVEDPMVYFFTQMLCGDSVDNIAGIKNPYKSHHKNTPCFTWDSALKILQPMSNQERLEFVQSAYQYQFGDEKWYGEFDLHTQLLWLLRKDGKTFEDYI